MPRPRFQKLEPEVRRRILEAAAKEFAAHGYRQASLNHIIDALGLSKGLFYYYFDDKADLFCSVVELMWETMFVDLIDIESLDGETFWPEVEALFHRNQQRIREQPWLMGIHRVLLDRPPGFEELFSEKVAEVAKFLERLLRKGQQVGAVRTDLPMNLLLPVLLAVDQASDRWLLEQWDRLEPGERNSAAENVLSLWRSVAAPPGKWSPSPKTEGKPA
jgi:AcrR family transcriptional regulator